VRRKKCRHNSAGILGMTADCLGSMALQYDHADRAIVRRRQTCGESHARAIQGKNECKDGEEVDHDGHIYSATIEALLVLPLSSLLDSDLTRAPVVTCNS
jgi:hypothetical protein